VRKIAAILVWTLLLAAPPGRARENVVMVNIDYFAESHRMRGAADARQAIADGKVEISTDAGFDIWYLSASAVSRQRRDREIAMREKVVRAMGLVPRPDTSGGCIIMPAADAYANGYRTVADAYLKTKFGPTYLAAIEAQVKRRLKAEDTRSANRIRLAYRSQSWK
jgi:hypothetical protein